MIGQEPFFQEHGITIRLNSTDALESLRILKPDHYKKISQILAREKNGRPQANEEKLKAGVRLPSVQRSVVVLTSLPAKQNLWFRLDGIRYEVTVTVR